jgi:hypothetical protein
VTKTQLHSRRRRGVPVCANLFGFGQELSVPDERLRVLEQNHQLALPPRAGLAKDAFEIGGYRRYNGIAPVNGR